jgi:UDP-2-acetamido-2-deoxy-ribo-hexuluronate aminotransferase
VMEFVDLKAQYRHLKSQIDHRIQIVLDHGRYILGPEVRELEEQLAARVGVRHCVSCGSGTDALLMALLALGIRPGDEIITAPFTFFATGEMITLAGGTPIFIDVDPATYNIDARGIEAAITPRTRAIMPVNLFGQPADMDAVNDVAARHKLPVIEDAAQSFGAIYRGRHSGNLGTIGCTSFFPSKPLGCYGDGGACFTNDDSLAETLIELRNHGQSARYHHSRIGINGRLDTLEAAVLLAKLEVFDQELTARAEIADRYTALLREVVQIPHMEADRSSVWAQYTIETDDRNELANALEEMGIPTAVHYPVPLHQQPVYAELAAQKGWMPGSFPAAERAAKRVLSLPMHPYLAPTEIENIADMIRSAVATGGRAR